MEQQVEVSPEDFRVLVDVFRDLRKWRDENNEVLLSEDSQETPERSEDE
jgi:hypothetical protein